MKKEELTRYKERRIELFINISIALIIGFTASIFTINFLKVDGLFFRTIYLFISAIGILTLVYIFFLLLFKDFFGGKLILFKKAEKSNLNLFLLTLIHHIIFLTLIILFISVVLYLGQLLHPLILSLSIVISSAIIMLYDHFTKKEKRSSIKTFTIFFFFSSIILFISVLFFSSYGLSKGINLEPQNVSFNVYVVNNALSQKETISALDYGSSLWNKYNVSIITESINYKEINLSSEDILFLFNKGNIQEECLNYSKILTKIRGNSTELSIIFLNNLNSGYAGRGCLCNCSSALISPDRLWIFDFTGWDVAHEIGHVLGLSDIQYYGRIKENLMNDETKKLLFFNSGFLDQEQLNKVVNKIESFKIK